MKISLNTEDLQRLLKLIDMPKAELRRRLAYGTNGTDSDAMNETRGRTRGELIVRHLNGGFDPDFSA